MRVHISIGSTLGPCRIARGAGAVVSEQDAFNQLCGYTLAHALNDPSFIHQHVVDAFAAQRAGDQSKPISITFALIGLYLRVEKGFSGKQVQRVHMRLGREKHAWPAFVLPDYRGAMTAMDVVAVPPGPERDRAIDTWCASVWGAFGDSRQSVADLLKRHGIVG